MSIRGLFPPGTLEEIRALSLEAEARARKDWDAAALGGQTYLGPPVDPGVNIRARSHEDARLLLRAGPHIGELVRALDYLQAENDSLKAALAGDMEHLRKLQRERSG